MKRIAITVLLAFSAAIAHAATLEERAQRLAQSFQRAVPIPLGTKGMVESAEALGSTLTMKLDAKIPANDYDRQGESDLIKDVCAVPTPSTEFIAAGGAVEWVIRLEDGQARTLLLTRQNCNPPKLPATSEELEKIAASIQTEVPFRRSDGVIVRDVTAGPGTQLVFWLSLDQLVPRERVPQLRADLDFAMRLSRMTKGYCDDDTTQLMIRRGVKYLYVYQAWGVKIYETTLTMEYCGLS